MKLTTLVPTVLLTLTAGCVAPRGVPAPGPESPVSPEAAEAPLPTPSTTLAIASPPPAVSEQPTVPMPEMKGMEGMHHGAMQHDMKGMKMNDDVPPKGEHENAPLSAPRTPVTLPATAPGTTGTSHSHHEHGGEQ